MGILKNASESASRAPEPSKPADTIFAIARLLLVPASTIAVITAALVWLLYDTGFSMILALFLLFFMLAVSLLLGMMVSSLTGEGRTEEAQTGTEQALKERPGDREREEQQGQQETRPREAEQDRPKEEQRRMAYRTSQQDGGAHTVPVSPKELRALPYKEYLRTPHWKRKREAKLRSVGRRCQFCNRGPHNLDVHHRTYERLGEELDQDLTVLCRACHTNFHENRTLGR
ncbi:MAG: hypothetical protein CYG60_13800 [Actinobacteria bacterium]|nr:MAG: hypothetical protein CYG60_13800 [Actinomycetota bacterium]